MRFPLTIVYITAREKPEFKWIEQSLVPQIQFGENVSVILVDGLFEKRETEPSMELLVRGKSFFRAPPKPTVWQGKHRLTSVDWWANSNARNTGICLCRTPWIAFLDDRSFLMPDWLQSVRHAMDGNYAVFGAYEKVSNLKTNGHQVVSYDEFPNKSGKDSRELYVKNGNHPIPFDCGGEWAFGCTLALPLEWVLNVGGYDETCDGVSMEDVIFGLMLANNGYTLKYDPRMKILEDRTSSELGPTMKRADKGVSPKDKSHAMLDMLKNRKTAMHGFDIREVRRKVLAGEPWPPPWGPQTDFYDGQPVSEMI